MKEDGGGLGELLRGELLTVTGELDVNPLDFPPFLGVLTAGLTRGRPVICIRSCPKTYVEEGETRVYLPSVASSVCCFSFFLGFTILHYLNSRVEGPESQNNAPGCVLVKSRKVSFVDTATNLHKTVEKERALTTPLPCHVKPLTQPTTTKKQLP